VIRTGRRARFPARFLLVAAMNPCPCGFHSDPEGRCRCEPSAVTRYQGRLSGPLLDRMDLRLPVLPPLPGVLLRPSDPAEARRVRDRVARAREAARAGVALSAPDREGGREPLSTAEARAEVAAAALRRRYSPRGVVRTLRVARTLALLEGADEVGLAHMREALHFREGGVA
jgi:magnesium chelatase family protein